MDSMQEPLDVLPGLLRCRRKEAVDLIDLISENSSPKEVLIVIQETLEQLVREDDVEEECFLGSVQCLINVIVMSTKCEYFAGVGRSLTSQGFTAVPRLTLGKRTALSVISPLVAGVSSAVTSLGSHFTRDNGRSLLAVVSRMSEAFYTWVFNTCSEADAAEARVCLQQLRQTALHTHRLAEIYQITSGHNHYRVCIVYQGIVMCQSIRDALSSSYIVFCNRTRVARRGTGHSERTGESGKPWNVIISESY